MRNFFLGVLKSRCETVSPFFAFLGETRAFLPLPVLRV